MMRTRTATLERAGQGCLFAHAIATKGALNGRHLPAAVVTDQGAFVAHAVPSGAELVEMDGVVFGYFAQPARMKGRWTLHVQRLAEIEKLIAYRHGGPCDTDEGETYLLAAAPHLMAEAGAPRTPRHRAASLISWAGAWTPRLPAFLGPDVDWFDALEREFTKYPRPKPLRADALAKELCVTLAERTALRLKSIGATDMTARQRKAARKSYDVQYQKAKREREGATPRERSVAATKPWQALGLSKATWYRNRASETVSSATSAGRSEARETVSSAVVLHTLPTTNPSHPEKKHSRDDAKRHRPRGERRLSAADEPAKGKEALVLQPDLFDTRPTSDGLAEALNGYTGGIIPPTVRMIVLDLKRGLGISQEDMARQMDISRPQVANGLQGRYGLSQGAASRLKTWVIAAARKESTWRIPQSTPSTKAAGSAARSG